MHLAKFAWNAPHLIPPLSVFHQAYYGGEARCDEQAGAGDSYDPQELVCGACSDVTMAQVRGIV